MNWRMLASIAGTALGLNAVTIVLDTNYMASVLLVFAGVIACALFWSAKNFSTNDAKAIVAFSVVVDLLTTGIEKLMMVFDVWGFSRAHHYMIGLTLFGAPIEEYVYWWLCPVLVACTYFAFARDRLQEHQANKLLHVEQSLSVLIACQLSRYIDQKKQKAKYLEDDGIEPADSRYARGASVPVWAFLPAIALGSGLWVMHRFRGKFSDVASTVIVFCCVAYPNELYSLSQGLWVYNQNRIIGIWFGGVPVEEWCMYVFAPWSGSMLASWTRTQFFADA